MPFAANLGRYSASSAIVAIVATGEFIDHRFEFGDAVFKVIHSITWFENLQFLGGRNFNLFQRCSVEFVW